jgi:phosphatidylglycerophosphate synthase
MLDGIARQMIDPLLGKMGRQLAHRGIGADQVTLFGLVAGFACAAALVWQWDTAAILFLAINRLADGLDGAVARAGRLTDRGGFLDITCDFIFYGSIPLAFALRDPALNALPSAVLLAAFYANGASFLAFAAIAAKRRMETQVRGAKTLYFTTGLVEGTETILFFTAFILLPHWFAPLAYLFAALCALTCLSRILLGWRIFNVDDSAK